MDKSIYIFQEDGAPAKKAKLFKPGKSHTAQSPDIIVMKHV